MDNSTGLLTITEEQFENLQSLMFEIGVYQLSHSAESKGILTILHRRRYPVRAHGQRSDLATLSQLYARRRRGQDLPHRFRLGIAERPRARLYQ